MGIAVVNLGTWRCLAQFWGASLPTIYCSTVVLQYTDWSTWV